MIYKSVQHFLITVFAALFVHVGSATAQDINPACPDANILTNVFDQVCWDCFLDSVSLMGVSTGREPEGASNNGPLCSCSDALGVPEIGFPMSFWSPQKINEVVTTPWCSPALGGIKLQDTLTGLGYSDTSSRGDSSPSAFYQYHYFSYPLMTMLGMLVMPSCSDGYMDFDLMYLSEVDPLHNNDLLALLLNPESLIMANPAGVAWCSIDCATTTADAQREEFYGCAGCDGFLYPLTGNVPAQKDPVAGSSLITQRVLAGLHRKGLADKTIGDEAMCGTSYFPTIPRSQYKFSMIYPVPEAGSADTLAWATSQNESDQSINTREDLAGTSGLDSDAFKDCCHPMGMSTARWCTPYGGRTRPGKDNAYLYMIWNYRDCCVRGGNAQ
jgi:conjugal transfer pilus assembly protein TraU